MVNRTKWCSKGVKSLHDANFKSVIYNPNYRGDVKPFVCTVCKKRYSHEDLGLKRNLCKSYTIYETNVRTKKLAKMFRVHCQKVYLKKNRGVLV